MLGDLRGIFLTAESAPSVARFRVALSVLGSCLVENCSEANFHFQWRTRAADRVLTLELEGCDIINGLNQGKEDGYD